MEIEDVAEKATIWSDAIKKIVAAITAIGAVVNRIAGTSKETADNTRKSVADKNFVSSPFISSTVLQTDNRIG